jgi:hypothetical protein
VEQLLDAVLSVPSLAGLDLLLAVHEMLSWLLALVLLAVFSDSWSLLRGTSDACYRYIGMTMTYVFWLFLLLLFFLVGSLWLLRFSGLLGILLLVLLSWSLGVSAI